MSQAVPQHPPLSHLFMPTSKLEIGDIGTCHLLVNERKYISPFYISDKQEEVIMEAYGKALWKKRA